MDVVVPELAIHEHDARGLHEQRQDILSVYSEANADQLDDQFYSPARYWERLAAYASRDGFGLVTGRLDAELVGYALGYPLPAGSGWWRGIRGEVDQALLTETGQRTFAFNELMVRPQWRRRGYASALHDALLRRRPEARATLLVRPDNTAAHLAYRSWGWHKIGELQPFDDAPIFDAMVLELHE
ncbi:MAG TPA: GNAT family N-acetyltransferase [Pseudonocardiaceae bacterium]